MNIPRVGVFGTMTRTNTLLVIHMLGETHAREVAKILEMTLSAVQKAVLNLEAAGLIVGTMKGQTRRITLNPRYAYLPELNALLQKMGDDNVAMQEKLGQLRRRPRRSGKPL